MGHSPDSTSPMQRLSATLAFSIVFSATAFAQFDERWVEYELAPGLISAGAVSSPDLETDLGWADLDQDGRVDLVVVRVEPIMAEGPRTNVLLMNEGGVLVDRTVEFASASDAPGDAGFLSATADRDVVIVDVDGDGWLDVVTAVGFGVVTDPVHVSHPRVYRNLGDDTGGEWLGLRYESARFPTLIHATTGLPVVARFNAVAAGDVDGDGDADLYFSDHDGTAANVFDGEDPDLDTDDRLFLNDGTGFFTDATAASLTPAMVASGYANSCAIADFDLDGENDIVKHSSFPLGAGLAIAYNDPLSPGSFSPHSQIFFGTPYAFSPGDLNSDGRLDLVVSSNGLDGIIYNQSTGVDGTVNWSGLIPFEFLVGGDDGFAANSVARDLDGDGLEDVLIADVDPQLVGYDRRMHVYHNRGVDTSGQAELREERESASDDDWIGVVGPVEADLMATHDVAVFDVDGDGLEDLVISRRAGTVVWRRVEHCQEDLGGGAPGYALEVCGSKLGEGHEAELRVTGGLPNAPAILLVSASANPVFVPDLQATVLAFPPLLIETLLTDGDGELSFPVAGGSGPLTVVAQFLVANGLPTLAAPTNAVQIELLGE